jgi:hypothetical protein
MSDNAELSLDHVACSCTILVIGDQRYAAINCADLLHAGQSTSLGDSASLVRDRASNDSILSNEPWRAFELGLRGVDRPLWVLISNRARGSF